MTTHTVPRRQSRLDCPAPDVKATLDRLKGRPVPAGWRTRKKPTFNSAV